MPPYYKHGDQNASALFALWEFLERLWLRDVSHVNNYRHQGIGNSVANLPDRMGKNGKAVPLAMIDDFSNLALCAQVMGERFANDEKIAGVLLISDLVLETPPREVLRRYHLDQQEVICDNVRAPMHSLTPSLFGRCVAAPLAKKHVPDVSAGVIVLRKPVFQNNAPVNISPLFIFWMFREGDLGTKVVSDLTRYLHRFDPVPVYFFKAQNTQLEEFSKIDFCTYNQAAQGVFALTSPPRMSLQELSADSNCDFFCDQQEASHAITCALSENSHTFFDAEAELARARQNIEVQASAPPDPFTGAQLITLLPRLSSVVDERGEKKIPLLDNGERRAIEVRTTCQTSLEFPKLDSPRLRLVHEWGEGVSQGFFEHLIPDSAPRKREIVSLLNNLQHFFRQNIMLENPTYTIKYRDRAAMTE